MAQNPSKIIRALYERRAGDTDEDCVKRHYDAVREHFAALLASDAQVPVLTDSTIDLLPNQTLVRFRGMVQDMPNPEYYVGEYRCPDGSWQTSRYQDELDDALPEGAETKFAERRPLLLVPVPGETDWVQRMQAAEAAASAPAAVAAQGPGGSGAKRGRDALTETRDLGAADDTMSISMLVSDATGETDAAAAADDGDSAAARPRNSAALRSTHLPAAPALDEIPAGAVMVYVYDDSSVKLNEVFEVVGVLSRVPELAAAHLACGGGEGAGGALSMLGTEDLSCHLPTSRVPRLHALLMTKEASPFPPLFGCTPAPPAQVLAASRARALGFLSMVLGGDDLAAEFLLLQLVSRVHLRSKDAGALGLLPLNISGCPSPAAPAAAAAAPASAGGGLSPLGAAVAAAVAALSPRSLALPLSVEALNARPWWPSRNQNDLRLVSAPLQLAPGTHLVLDETAMAAGTLSEVGLRNLAALQEVMRAQRVAYDFEFFELDQPTDAPVTVLSTGRTLLKGVGEVEVRLAPPAPCAAGAAAVAAAAAAADLAPARTFLAATRALHFSIPEELGTQIEGEMADARRRDAKNVNQETFHRWLNLARLLSVSHGEAELTAQRWEQAVALEEQCQQRLVGARAEGQ